MVRVTGMSYFRKSLTTEMVYQRSSSKMLSSQHKTVIITGVRQHWVEKFLYSGRTGYIPGFY